MVVTSPAKVRGGIMSKEQAAEEIPAWQEVLRTSPGIVSLLPAWHSLKQIPLYQIGTLERFYLLQRGYARDLSERRHSRCVGQSFSGAFRLPTG